MMSDPSGGVVFDFDGALDLARRLWALADEWEQAYARRAAAASAALARWTGPAAHELTVQLPPERQASVQVCYRLRDEAQRWAMAWAAAADDRHRQATSSISDAALSFAVPVPAGPRFEPTVSPGWFGR
jgi:hypothetical protein